MLYLIGLGLDTDSISKYGSDAILRCEKIYLENYTVEFPYSAGEIEKAAKKEIHPADREFIESLKIIEEAKKEDVALLVYGSPLTATTHISLIQECRKKKVKYKIIYNASVLDAIAETGLQMYKFGKIASIPKWTGNFSPKSFAETIKQNLSIGAHTLLLIDIGLEPGDALDELHGASEEYGLSISKIAVCSRLGTKDSKISYDKPENLRRRGIKPPFCFIIPGKLHFVEEEMLDKYATNKF